MAMSNCRIPLGGGGRNDTAFSCTIDIYNVEFDSEANSPSTSSLSPTQLQ